MPPAPPGTVRVGTSGWLPRWRQWVHARSTSGLAALAQGVGTVEITQSFSALQQPAFYRHCAAATPEDFVFAVKARRYITHVKKLRSVSVPLANFFASGVLALGPKLGPVLWELPPNVGYDPDRLARFLDQLPHSTVAAARLAAEHDDYVTEHAWTVTDADRPVRHALEVRHPSFADPEFVELLRAHDVALVIADSAGAWPCFEAATANHVYVRLHGADWRRGGYSFAALDQWAGRIDRWAAGPPPRDVYVYLTNGRGRATHDALALARRVGALA